ncbi:unnamed protein product [Lepidochelys kempii]
MLPSDLQGFRKGEPVMRAAWECMCHHQPSYIKALTSMDSSIRCPQGRLGINRLPFIPHFSDLSDQHCRYAGAGIARKCGHQFNTGHYIVPSSHPTLTNAATFKSLRKHTLALSNHTGGWAQPPPPSPELQNGASQRLLLLSH